MKKYKTLVQLLVIFITLITQSYVCANESFSLYIDISEGGQLSKRYTERLKTYLQLNDCAIDTIVDTSADTNSNKTTSNNEFDSNFIFIPISKDLPNKYSKILDISIENDQQLSGSILVRKETGINNIEALKDIPIAYISESSLTGYQLQEELFKAVNIQHAKENITFAQSNEAAVSLLLHKEVIAVGVVTSLAKLWEKSNGLSIVATSKSVSLGGLWVNNNIDNQVVENCKKAFIMLPYSEQKYKKLMKLFPAWVERFQP